MMRLEMKGRGTDEDERSISVDFLSYDVCKEETCFSRFVL